MRQPSATQHRAVAVPDIDGVLDALRRDGIPVFHADWAAGHRRLWDLQAEGLS